MELKNIFLELILFTIAILPTNADNLPLEDILKGQMTENSELTAKWIEPPLIHHKHIYLFNVTNPNDIVQGDKPILQEIGPYVFSVHSKKVNVSFNNDEGTVSYDLVKWYKYLPQLSNGTLDDQVTVLNVPFMGLAIKSEGTLSFMQQMMLKNLIRNFRVSPFVTKTVDEMLYKGYRDPFMVMIGQIKGQEVLPKGTFGFFHGQNYTSEGSYTVHTGVKDSSKFLKINRYNNMTELPYYNGEKCNKIEGSIDRFGLIFGVNISKDDLIHVYTPELCRSLPFKFLQEEGTSSFKYVLPEAVSASANVEPDNSCFCPTEDRCLKAGVFSTEQCNPNSPRIWSYPHFYLADDSYYDAVVGLNRDEDLHESYIDVNRVYGYETAFRKRLQMNIAVKPVSHIQFFNNFPEMIFPLMWFDEKNIL
uniref:Scavenger receptor class B member 1 n=1 Tax=Strigamia maritima TaxID=126957 RepID=T1IUI9_STRMM